MRLKASHFIIILVYCFLFSNCNAQTSKCPKKDRVCKCKELISFLATEDYFKAKKFFMLDENGEISGQSDSFLAYKFLRIHQTLQKYRSVPDSAYKVVQNPNPMLGKDVVVTLIDSMYGDSDFEWQTVNFGFNDVERSGSAELLDFFIDSKRRQTQESIRKDMEEMKRINEEYPFPENYTPPLHK